jgi:hypothetical protein
MYHKLLKTTSTMFLFSLSIHVRGILVKTDHGNHMHYSSYLTCSNPTFKGVKSAWKLVLRGWLSQMKTRRALILPLSTPCSVYTTRHIWHSIHAISIQYDQEWLTTAFPNLDKFLNHEFGYCTLPLDLLEWKVGRDPYKAAHKEFG